MRLTPQLSIIIPTFNSAKTLANSLQSIADQGFKDVEVLVIDGGSKDETVRIATDFESKLPKLIVKSEPDKGTYDAMNKGIHLAQGDWLFFLGSDDVLYNKHVLETVFSSLTSEDQMLYGNVRRTSTGTIYDGPFDKGKLMQKNICHQAIFYHKHLFTLLGTYDIAYVACADWAFNLLCFGHPKVKCRYIDVVISHYNDDGFSTGFVDKKFLEDQLLLVKTAYGISYWNPSLHPYQFNFLTKALQYKGLGAYSKFAYFYILYRYHSFFKD